MRDRPSDRQVNWAHSIMNDRGATPAQKRVAKALIAWEETDPNEEADYRDDSFLEDDY